MSIRPSDLVALAALVALTGCMGGNPLSERVAPIPPALATPAMAAAPTGSIYAGHSGRRLLLAEDRRARQVGDMLTILLVERLLAEKSTGQESSRTSERSTTLPAMKPFSWIPNELFGGGQDNRFSGQGSARQTNRLSGEITVTVVDVMPNGALLVAGDRRLVLTRGEEQVQLTGIVRPEDIGPDNRILSTRVADARLRYTGTGEVAAQARQGWLARFFDRLSPF
jgi:flagellar L-ring protein precursor FlgH